MKIKCPDCSAANEIQKFCGSCGAKLLNEGVELEGIVANVDIQPKKPKRRWFLGIMVFLGIWILGDVVFSYFAGSAGLNERYIGGITFILGLIALWEIVRNKDDIEIDESTIK